jgi:similar to stage IV sporulation protein
MQGFVNLLRGSVCIRVMGRFPERFLNLCAQRGVAFGAWSGWTPILSA